ncbi:hypothetical protein KIKIMORA_00090 [Brevundimonas phage vB_BpoS-Kikimora]|uniref:Uncharacterized protein n=1 Tax=Brevundimonas phage vB_BpoS-Kikimora TaxID=2948601 RepID=A0A9E7MT21_9CAUD|nr:hypothetical protein KIKIMORA_00090 [Brevundimonas phage vB_BpoS-Kikimora]
MTYKQKLLASALLYLTAAGLFGSGLGYTFAGGGDDRISLAILIAALAVLLTARHLRLRWKL